MRLFRSCFIAMLGILVAALSSPSTQAQDLNTLLRGLKRALGNEQPQRRQTEQRQGKKKQAAGQQNWHRLAPANGIGTTVCNTAGDAYACFAIRCLGDMDPQLIFFFKPDRYEQETDAAIVVDGTQQFDIESMWKLPLGDALATDYNSARHRPLLDALRSGSEFTFDPGFKHTFTLRGSSAEIDRITAECGLDVQPPAAVAAAPATPSVDGVSHISLLFGEKIDVPAYRDTGNDPSLLGLDHHQCERFCQADRKCRAYTYLSDKRHCALMSSHGSVIPYPGAHSGLLTRADAPPPAMLRDGPDAVVVKPDFWRDGDTRETYVARLRTAAVQLGGACEAEEAELRQLAQSFSVTLAASSALAGESVAIAWNGNTLKTRIPAYLIVSSEQPVRFGGALALNAGAIGPFGIDTMEATNRAFVPLHTSDAGLAGKLTVTPLLVGGAQLTASLVGYLRACERVVELSRNLLSLTVEPGAPRVVLHDPYGPIEFTSEVAIPAFGRTIHVSDTRLMIANSSDGSEILEREGKDLALSASMRFAAVKSDDFYDIIDVVDGATVARISSGSLSWFNADSFVVSESMPWGITSLASTISDAVLIENQRTSCASCSSRDSAMLNVDLENGIVFLGGPLGYQFASLQDLTRSRQDPDLIVADQSMNGVGAMARAQAEDLGAATVVQFGVGWNAPLGLSRVYDDGAVGETGATAAPTTRHAATLAMLVARGEKAGDMAMASAGMSADGVLRMATTGRLEPGGNALPSDRTLLSALEPFGFVAGTGRIAEPRLTSPTDEFPQGDEAAQETRRSKQEAEAEKIRRAVAGAMRKSGRKIEWLSPGEEFDSHCNYFVAERGVDSLPGDLDRAHLASLAGRDAWIVRASCSGGPTYGTLMMKSYLAIFDAKRLKLVPHLSSLVVANTETLGNNPSEAFHDLDYSVKVVDDRYLLFYVPGGGALTLFDTEEWRFVIEQQQLARGDLLKDMHLSADGRHMLQENIDGSFAVIAVDGAERILEGRYIDDEVVVWNRAYQFDATSEGSAYVYLRFPGQPGQHALEQFSRQRLSRGVFAATLAGQPIAPPAAVSAPPRIEGKITLEGDIISAAISVAGATVRRIRLHQDGLLTDTVEVPNGTLDISIRANRLAGARFVSVIAEDDAGLLSPPMAFQMPAPEKAPIRTRLLAVGIDSYLDPNLPPLEFAKSDALLFYETLRATSGNSIDLLTADESILVDRRAPRDAILAKARELAETTAAGDNLVVFFAGHGLRGKDGGFYLGTADTDTARIEDTALAWTDLAAVLANAKGRITVLLDACHAGAAGLDFAATNDDAAEELQRAIPVPLTVIAASKGRQTSAEIDGHGVFTRAVADAIGARRQDADGNRNGAIETTELYRYVKRAVSQKRAGRQTPWLARNRTIGEAALF